MSVYAAYQSVLAEQATHPPSDWTFKQDPAYRTILEHVSPEQGRKYLAVIRADFPEQWNLYQRVLVETAILNDSLGAPERAEFPEMGITCSPTNLRYMLQAISIERHIRELNLGQVHLLEIGGGYGGLALFLSRLFPWRWLRYTIIDLPEAGAIQRAYAHTLGVPITTAGAGDDEAITTEVNRYAHAERFLISAYAFSEFSESTRERYTRLVVDHVPHGWLVWNMIPVYHFTAAALTVSPERPATSRENFLVRF